MGWAAGVSGPMWLQQSSSLSRCSGTKDTTPAEVAGATILAAGFSDPVTEPLTPVAPVTNPLVLVVFFLKKNLLVIPNT